MINLSDFPGRVYFINDTGMLYTGKATTADLKMSIDGQITMKLECTNIKMRTCDEVGPDIDPVVFQDMLEEKLSS